MEKWGGARSVDRQPLWPYRVCMTKVEEIKAEIDKLSLRERCELDALLNPLPDDEWDKQMRADAEPGGKLHRLMVQAEDEAKAGQLRDFPRTGRK